MFQLARFVILQEVRRVHNYRNRDMVKYPVITHGAFILGVPKGVSFKKVSIVGHSLVALFPGF